MILQMLDSRSSHGAILFQHSHTPLGNVVLKLEMIVEAGGCLVVIAQWSSALPAQARDPGFDSRRVPVFHFPLFHIKNISLFPAEEGC